MVPTSPERSDIDALVEGGVSAFKISSFEAHPTRFPRIGNAATLMSPARASRSASTTRTSFGSTIARLRAEGSTGPEFHSPSRPEVAQLTATANFFEVGAKAGAHLHIVHFSTPEGFALARAYRDRGVNATGEMCVHYLHFDAGSDMSSAAGAKVTRRSARDDATSSGG